jgi:sodium/potassium-transporting ATPase subunit alpha
MPTLDRSQRSAQASTVSAARLAAVAPSERLALVRSTPKGLSEEEARRRLRQFGPNEPVKPPSQRPLRLFLANFTHTLALLLWLAAALSYAAGIVELGTAIVAVIVINGVFAFVQEYRAEQVVESLMRRVAVRARVVRGGRERWLPAHELVPGDVVRLSAGDVVPADAALLAAEGLTIDLSLLTGETVPVERDPASLPEADERTPLSDLRCILPAGAAVVTGSGEAVVWATGPRSSVGRIAALVTQVERGASLLERQVADLSRTTVTIAVLVGAATLVLAEVTAGVDIRAGLTFATGVIVALVPEGLLPTLSVALAIGARRMAERGAAVRRLSAIEVVGSVTVICTDKTGTLTENRLSVLGFVGPDGDERVPEDALRAALLAGNAVNEQGAVRDPLDAALLSWATALGADPDALVRQCPILEREPFDPHRRYAAAVCALDGRRQELIKGAPEAVLAVVGVEPPPALQTAMAQATARGERVLLLALREEGRPARLLGLVCLHDPPRPEVPAAIAACRRAGIRVIMLTGDHPVTARAVAAAIGLGGDIPVVEGRQVDGMSDADLLRLTRTNAIFARVDPEQKLRLVQVLRRAGEVVVVTGDGVNDAPALHAADVGVAMGRRGTEVAKQAADIVLADDNFATIVAAIEEGRSIKQNIRRFVSYVFTSNVAELAPFLVYIFTPVPLPLAPIQAIGVSLGTDLLPALALGAEPPSSQTLAMPPEPPTSPLLTRALAARTFLYFGPVEAALGLAGFFLFYAAHGWRPFAPFATSLPLYYQATTATFLGIVAGQIGCLVAQRDGALRERLTPHGNPLVALGLAFELALTLALVYLPGLNHLFHMAAVPPVWLLMLPAGAALFLALDEARRALSRLRVPKRASR